MTLILLSAIAFSIFSVLGTGVLLLSVVDRFRKLSYERDFSENILLSAAFGFVWCAVSFLVLYFASAHSIRHGIFYGRFGMDIALISTTLVFLRPYDPTKKIIESFFCRSFALIVLIGLIIGSYGFFHFPHVLDSGQLLWTQQFLLSISKSTEIGSMIGFSGLIAPLGSLFKEYPLATVAAGFKPLLAIVALMVCRHAVLMLDLPNRSINAALLSTLMLSSYFGLFGLIEMGKDSMYGVLFSVAFLVLLCRGDVERRGLDVAIVFAAASVLGVIAVPYMLIALALWLVFAASGEVAFAIMKVFLLINGLTLPVVVAAFLKKPYWKIGIVYLFFSFFLMWMFDRLRRIRQLESARRVRDLVLLVLPLFSFLAAAALLPVAAELPVWMNVDGTIVTEVRAPLDGKTGILQLLFAYPVQHATVAVGLSALFIASFIQRVSKAMIAVSIMPLVALVLVLCNVRLGLQFLTPFNQWDLVKDVPAWYGGTAFALIAIAGIAFSCGRSGPRKNIVIGLLLIAPALHVIFRGGSWARLVSPVHYNAIGGSIDKDFSILMQAIWTNLQNRTIFVAPEIVPDHFYSIQMYGGVPTRYKSDTLYYNISHLREVGFVVPNEEVSAVAAYARGMNASLKLVSELGNGRQSLLLMNFNGRGEMSLPTYDSAQRRVAHIRSGAYHPERYKEFTFRWLQQSVLIDIPTDGQSTCLTIEAFRASPHDLPEVVNLSGVMATPSSIDLAGSAIENRKRIRVTIGGASGGSTSARLEATMPGRYFPNDNRKIAWGIVTPILVEPGKSCAQGN